MQTGVDGERWGRLDGTLLDSFTALGTGMGSTATLALHMCRNWQLTRWQKQGLKSHQVRFGEGTERVACGMVMDGLGVLGWEEVELVVNGGAWAGER